MAKALRSTTDLKSLKALDRATLAEIMVSPAALRDYADCTKVVTEGSFKDRGKHLGMLRSYGMWELDGAIRRALRAKN